jgi:primosomal replication protein N
VDKGRRKRVADIAEKLGVGLSLGVLVQGAFAKEITYSIYVGSAVIVAVALALLAVSIVLSQED